MPKLDLERIETARGRRTLATEANVAGLERQLSLKLPRGYADFVTKLGDGLLCGFVRVYLPDQVDKELKPWRRRIKQFWHWNQTSAILQQDAALKSFVLADTLEGDELIFNPASGRHYVLPKHLQEAYEVGTDFLTALEWLCRSGVLIPKIKDSRFEPAGSGERESSRVTEPIPAAPASTRNVRRMLTLSSANSASGTVTTRAYFLTSEHRHDPWDGVSRFAFDMEKIVSAAQAAVSRAGKEPPVVSSIQVASTLVGKDPTPYYYVTVEFATGKGTASQVLLDLDGNVIQPEVKSFRNTDKYREYEKSLSGN